jgi:hypothetical protein
MPLPDSDAGIHIFRQRDSDAVADNKDVKATKIKTKSMWFFS